MLVYNTLKLVEQIVYASQKVCRAMPQISLRKTKNFTGLIVDILYSYVVAMIVYDVVVLLGSYTVCCSVLTWGLSCIIIKTFLISSTAVLVCLGHPD